MIPSFAIIYAILNVESFNCKINHHIENILNVVNVGIVSNIKVSCNLRKVVYL